MSISVNYYNILFPDLMSNLGIKTFTNSKIQIRIDGDTIKELKTHENNLEYFEKYYKYCRKGNIVKLTDLERSKNRPFNISYWDSLRINKFYIACISSNLEIIKRMSCDFYNMLYHKRIYEIMYISYKLHNINVFRFMLNILKFKNDSFSINNAMESFEFNKYGDFFLTHNTPYVHYPIAINYKTTRKPTKREYLAYLVNNGLGVPIDIRTIVYREGIYKRVIEKPYSIILI